jgi:hypothetical protein
MTARSSSRFLSLLELQKTNRAQLHLRMALQISALFELLNRHEELQVAESHLISHSRLRITLISSSSAMH